MSLIITSSRQGENDTQISSENPANYTNFFRSDIEIPTNSCIAVESVKLERNAQVAVRDSSLALFYGVAKNASNKDRQIEIPRIINFAKLGTETIADWANTLQARINAQYHHPSQHNGTVVDQVGDEKLKITETFQGTASGTNQRGNLDPIPYWNLQIPKEAGGRFIKTNVERSDGYAYNLGTGHFTRMANPVSACGVTGVNGSTNMMNACCVAQLKDFPLGLNNGRFEVNVANASTGAWCVGLGRPHIQYDSKGRSDLNAGAGESYIDPVDIRNILPVHYEYGNNLVAFTGNASLPRTTKQLWWEHYDYVVYSDGAHIRIANSLQAQRSYYGGYEARYAWKHHEIAYWLSGGDLEDDPITHADFYADFDRIRFTAVGDGIRIDFGDKGKTTYQSVCGPQLTTTSFTCPKPIGDTTYALYPQINLQLGHVIINTFESTLADTSYKFPEYISYPIGAATKLESESFGAYKPGNDAYSSNRLPLSLRDWSASNAGTTPDAGRPIIDSATRALDLTQSLSMIEAVDGNIVYSGYTTILTSQTYTFAGVNASGGTNYSNVYIFDTYNRKSALINYLIPSQAMPNIAEIVGFPERSVLTDANASLVGLLTGINTLDVVLTSEEKLKKNSDTLFVRIPNLTQKSFNGAQSSLSKIVYQVPQFDNQGNESGPMYFAPGEKTYVKLNNAGPMNLNQIQVQIVDVQEKEVKTLGDRTQIVFHIKEC